MYLFLTALGLHCCTVFSLVAESGATLQLWCAAFSLQLLLLLWSTGSTQASVAAAPGLWSTGSIVVVHRLSC